MSCVKYGYVFLPCKKCNGNSPRWLKSWPIQGSLCQHKISCPICGYCTKTKATAEEAVRAWNQRDGIKNAIL